MGTCLQLKIVLQKTIDSRAYTNILNNIVHTENPEVILPILVLDNMINNVLPKGEEQMCLTYCDRVFIRCLH